MMRMSGLEVAMAQAALPSRDKETSVLTVNKTQNDSEKRDSPNACT